MSHNKIKVSGQEPNASGDIAVNLTNMSDVNINSPADNQILQYSTASSEWQNQTINIGSGLLILGQGDSDAYSNSGASSMTGAVYVYAPSASIVNTMGATINKYLGTDWVTSITLPAGNYQAMLTYRVKFSSSGYFNFGLTDTSGNTEYTTKAYIGEDRTTIDNAASTAIGYFELSSSTEIVIYNNNSSGVDSVVNQGDIPSEFSTLMIRSV
tara:strand:- start:3170 stop:3805 length:636 start_codon:yes stop_codon:yes gene_type:complete